MKYNKILIDMNNLYARAYYASQHLTHKLKDGTEIITGGVYTSVHMLRKIQDEFLSENGTIYLLYDNMSSNEVRRKDIDPDYKANRKSKEPAYYTGLSYLQLILLNYDDGMVSIQYPGHEADDLVLPILEQKTRYEYVLLVSQDLDWSRSINEWIHWAKESNGEYVVYTPELFEEEYGFHPTIDRVSFYKALDGDKVDNIERPVANMRKDLICKLITEFSGPKEMFADLHEISYISDKWRDRLREAKPRVLLNYSLVSFVGVPFEDIEEHMVETQYQPSVLHRLYNTLGFNARRFDKRMEEYLEPEDNGAFFQFSRVDRV